MPVEVFVSNKFMKFRSLQNEHVVFAFNGHVLIKAAPFTLSATALCGQSVQQQNSTRH